MKIKRSFKPDQLTADGLRSHISEPVLKGNRVLATNRHVLAIFPIARDPGDVDGHVPNKAFRIARGGADAFGDASIPCEKDEIVFKRYGERIVLERADNGEFPKTAEDLFPDGECHEIWINARKLLDLVAAMGGDGPCRLRFQKKYDDVACDKAIEVELYEAKAGEHAWGLLMPMKPEKATTTYHQDHPKTAQAAPEAK